MKIAYLKIFFLLFLSTTLVANSQHYNFEAPDKVTLLPDALNEVSDVTCIDHSVIACIQDEKGILFKFDIRKGSIISQDSFFVDGDYEGIAKVKNSLFVLRSDGQLIEIVNGVKGKFTVQAYITNVPANNNEGLCYDEKNNRLLIASKSRSRNTHDARDKRLIYEFDLETKKLLDQPFMEIDINAIKQFAGEKYQLSDSLTNEIRFRPSALAIHPLDRKLYVLTATGFVICIYNKAKLEDVILLNPVLFNKAEGISFTKKGDMIVSNEAGSNAAGTLLYFKYKK